MCSILWLWDTHVLFHVAVVQSFPLLYNIPLYKQSIHFYQFYHILVSFWFWLLQIWYHEHSYTSNMVIKCIHLLWPELLCPYPQSVCWNPQCDNIRRWAFVWCLCNESEILMSGISAFIKDPERSLAPFTTWGSNDKSETQKGPSCWHAITLISYFQCREL